MIHLLKNLFICATAALVLASCDQDDKDETFHGTLSLSKSSIELQIAQRDTISIRSGSGKYSLNIESPEIASVQIVNDTLIAIEALAQGETTINITDAITQKMQTATLKVTQIPVSTLQVSEKLDRRLNVGDTEKLTVTILPENATDKQLTFSSDDENIATVDAEGVITAKKGGIATITVTTANGLLSKSCQVAVVSEEIKAFVQDGVLAEGFDKISGTLVLPNDIENIDVYTFMDQDQLQTILLPEGLKQIGKSAFEGCKSLSEIEIPGGVEQWGSNAFNGCAALRKVTIKEGVTAIGSNSFKDCKSLEEISLPSSLVKIGTKAFANCEALKTINLPQNIATIKTTDFTGCNSLASINLSDDAPNMSVENGVLYNKEKTQLILCGAKNPNKEITLPNTVTTIPAFAFQNNTTLEKIVFPASISSIESNAFGTAEALNTIEFTAATPKFRPLRGAEFNTSKTITVVVPQGAIEAYKTIFGKKYTNFIFQEKQ